MVRLRQRVLRFRANLCNLSTCRYAFNSEDLQFPGAGTPEWCRMLVDFELIARAQKGARLARTPATEPPGALLSAWAEAAGK